MDRITLEEIEQKYHINDYKLLIQKILDLIEEEKIKPIKASKKNGKSPSLYKEYWIVKPKKDLSAYKDEILYQLVPSISTDYYLKHLPQYEQDREWVLMLNSYLRNKKENLNISVSMNERSFAIWNREKFLKSESGTKILKRCKITIADLNIYDTTEPMAYYSASKHEPQNILIIENKDTFYSMRRYLISNNNKKIIGLQIGTLIYGAGKGILKSFQDFAGTVEDDDRIFCRVMEPYMLNRQNSIYYFGDLDYEGIGIYENLARTFKSQLEIKPFTNAYQAMLEKAKCCAKLPKTKEKQNRNITDYFFSYFEDSYAIQMKEILESDSYIPQEILSYTDLQSYKKRT